MVFNSPTEIDLINSDRHMFERMKLLSFNYYLRLKPHIFSHVILEIRFNKYLLTPIRLPPENNIYVVLRGNRKFCEQINCQSFYPRGALCNENDNPLVFKSGNTDIVACQSSCYNLFDKKKAKDGLSYRAPFTRFSNRQNCCTMLGNDMFSAGADDYCRTDNHVTPRMDTIGTGFDLDDEPYTDLEGNETYKFKMNKYYCDDFMRSWDGTKCYTPLHEEIFGFIVSSVLYKACQYGVRYAQTGITATNVNKPNVPPIVTTAPTYDEWFNDVNREAFFVNPHVTLTQLGITDASLKHLIFTTEYGWPGRLVEPLIVYQSVGNVQPDVKIVDYDELNKTKLYQFKCDSYGLRLTDEYDFLNIYKHINENALSNIDHDINNGGTVEDDKSVVLMKFIEFLKTLTDSLFTWQMPVYILVGVVQDRIIASIVQGLTSMAEKFETGFATRFMFLIAQRLLMVSISPVFMKPVFKLITMTLKLLATTLKTVEQIISIISLIDIIDIGVDFFNLQNEMGSSTIQQYSEADILSRKKAYGYGTVEYSPAMLIAIYEYIAAEETSEVTPTPRTKENKPTTEGQLPPYSSNCSLLKDYKTNDAQWKLKLESVVDRFDYMSTVIWSSEYLYSLDVNSNGLPINWNEEYGIVDIKDMNEFFDTAFKSYLNNFDNYDVFSKNFKKKINMLKYGIPMALVLLLVFTFMGIIYAVMFLFFMSSVMYVIVFTDILTPETDL